MKDKSITFTIDYQIYPFELMVFVNETDDTFRKTLHDRLPEDMRHEIEGIFPCSGAHDIYKARTGIFSGGMSAMHLKFWPENTKQHGLVSHEIFHAVHFLMERLKMPLDFNNCEAYAYLIQYITEQIYNNISKATLKVTQNKRRK